METDEPFDLEKFADCLRVIGETLLAGLQSVFSPEVLEFFEDAEASLMMMSPQEYLCFLQADPAA